MTIEEAVRTRLLTLSAVAALTTTIKFYELLMTDLPQGGAAIVIRTANRTWDDDNNLDGRTTLARATVIITSLSRKLSVASSLAEAVRTNSTNPGTGMGPCTVTTGDLPFQATLLSEETDRARDEDGSDIGVWSVEQTYALTFTETQ